jgi:excisionase family DNA binding protein
MTIEELQAAAGVESAGQVHTARPVLRHKTTYSVTEAAELLGIHRETAYLQIAAGKFPVKEIKLGRRIRIPCAPLDRLLGLGDDVDTPTA